MGGVGLEQGGRERSRVPRGNFISPLILVFFFLRAPSLLVSISDVLLSVQTGQSWRESEDLVLSSLELENIFCLLDVTACESP